MSRRPSGQGSQSAIPVGIGCRLAPAASRSLRSQHRQSPSVTPSWRCFRELPHGTAGWLSEDESQAAISSLGKLTAVPVDRHLFRLNVNNAMKSYI